MRKMYDEATCKAIKDGEDHARRLHKTIAKCRERYGSLLKKFLSVKSEEKEIFYKGRQYQLQLCNEDVKNGKRSMWLARAERAHTEFAYWCVLAYYCPREKFNVKHSRAENKIMKYPVEWKSWWFDHEEKCRNKTEEYK